MLGDAAREGRAKLHERSRKCRWSGVDTGFGESAMGVSSRTRRHNNIGGWSRSAGLLSAWGETDAHANCYHEQASPIKPAAGAQTR